MIERICQKCGKVFIPAAMHAYTEGGRMYCSWTCFNHRNDNGKPGKRKYKYVEVYDMHGELLRRFASANDAAEYTGFSIKRIQDACRYGKAYNGFMWKYKE